MNPAPKGEPQQRRCGECSTVQRSRCERKWWKVSDDHPACAEFVQGEKPKVLTEAMERR